MTPRELELYIERLKRAQEMIETNDIGQFQEKIMEVKSYLDQFNGLHELLNHMKAISEIAYTIKEFYTIDEASKYLGLSKSTVYKITSNRELTYTNRIYLFLLLYSLNSLNQTDKFSPVSFIIMIQSLFSQTDYFVISSLTLEIRIPE